MTEGSNDSPSVEDRILEMQFKLGPITREQIKGLMPFDDIAAAKLAIPQQDIPVHATVNGKKVKIGTAHVDPETKIVTTKIDKDNVHAQIFLDNVWHTTEGKYSLAGIVQVSELTMIASVDASSIDPDTIKRSDKHQILPVCPECRNGKHVNCDGTAWDESKDAMGPCHCPGGCRNKKD